MMKANGQKISQLRVEGLMASAHLWPLSHNLAGDLVMDSSYTGQVSRVVELLQGKWTVQILCAMRTRPVRLSELKRAIPAASKKALTASLRSLEAARVILRRELSGPVLRVEYEFAAAMREPMVSLLDHLAEWGKTCDLEKLSTKPPSAPSSSESNPSSISGYRGPKDKAHD